MFRFTFVLILLVAAGSSCVLAPGAVNPAGLKTTAQAGSDATLGSRQLIQTANALSTQFSSSGMVETAQAYATAMNAPATSTNNPTPVTLASETPTLPSTETSPEPTATALASTPTATEGTIAAPTPSPSATPELRVISDIPLPQIELERLYRTPNFISFATSLSLESMADFFEEEMPKLGWAKSKSDSYSTEQAAQLTFDKPGRRASVSIQLNPLAGRTVVLISIQNR